MSIFNIKLTDFNFEKLDFVYEIHRLSFQIVVPSHKVTSMVALLIPHLLEGEKDRILFDFDELDNNLTPFSAHEESVHYIVNEVFIF